jgi:hypothetical protein
MKLKRIGGYSDQTNARAWVRTYVDKNGITSLKQIAAYVEEKTGTRPADNTVAAYLRDLGYEYVGEWRVKE